MYVHCHCTVDVIFQLIMEDCSQQKMSIEIVFIVISILASSEAAPGGAGRGVNRLDDSCHLEVARSLRQDAAI